MTWQRTSHPDLDDDTWELFFEHFRIFPFSSLPEHAVGLELGSRRGLWASLISQRAVLHCVEADRDLLEHSRAFLDDRVELHHGPLDDPPVPDHSVDFAYALNIDDEDPRQILAACARKLKPGAPFLLYLCYALDNRPAWYRTLWCASDLLRRGVSAQPKPVRSLMSTAIALYTYWPLARTARILEQVGVPVESIPLSSYRRSSFRAMRAGALERFAVDNQPRFARSQIQRMLEQAGFRQIQFDEQMPFWTALCQT